jgi:hypothetical protein
VSIGGVIHDDEEKRSGRCLIKTKRRYGSGKNERENTETRRWNYEEERKAVERDQVERAI